MRGCSSVVFLAALAAVGSNCFADEAKESAAVKGRVLVLKEATTEPMGSMNWGGLIVVEIPDSGSRPPQEMKVDGGKCVALGHVRGVNTNREGRPLMGGGYTWYLFKAPAEGKSVQIEASYLPNGQRNPKPVKRHYVVQLNEKG
jgi:hypothetical protein